MSTEKTIYRSGNDTTVTQISYAPNGTDHELQRRITELMHNIVTQVGKFTLAELGYLHLNTLMYNKNTGAVRLRVYFDVHYAGRVSKSDMNQGRKVYPVDELNVFKGFLFVGNLEDIVTYETIMAPRSKTVEDEKGRASIQIKDGSKYEKTDVLVMNCNLPITMAAAHNISLTDPNFKVEYTTVGRGGKKAEKMILTSANMEEVPLAVTVTGSSDDSYRGYHASDAVPYLTALAESLRKASSNQRKLEEKIKKDAKKEGQKKKTKQYAGFAKYS